MPRPGGSPSDDILGNPKLPPFPPNLKGSGTGAGGLKPRKNDSQLGGGGELSGMATSQAWGVGQGRKKQLPSAVFSPRCSRGNTDGSSNENTMTAGVWGWGGGWEELEGLHVVCVSGRLDSVGSSSPPGSPQSQEDRSRKWGRGAMHEAAG